MRKLDIARRVHQEPGISVPEAVTLLEGILELLKTTLQQGEAIGIQEYGKWTVRSKRPRKGRNPRTGEAVMIAARRAVTFRASPHLKREVNPF
jgi:integration host factor subunit alpha